MEAAVAASSKQTAATAARVPAAVAASSQPAANAAADPPAENSAPTAESVFGPNPWIADPKGTAPDGSSYSYNPFYFATVATAAKVAQMFGGTVVASNQLADAGGFGQQQPNQMVRLPDGSLINPGLVASYYTHGYPQSYLDMLMQNKTQGA
jgi:hypothetical protein